MEQIKQPTLTELKAYAYDTLTQINNLQNQLDYLNNQINKVKQQVQKPEQTNVESKV